MFITSRRQIQQRLDEMQSAMSPAQLQALVRRLNRPGPDLLAAAWEVIILSCLARSGEFEHEAELPSGRRPDFRLESGGLKIWGDVATISDRGLEERNAVATISDELKRLAKKYGRNPSHFGFDVRGEYAGEFGDARVQLSIPPRPALLKIIAEQVEPWFRGLKEGVPEKRAIADGEVAFEVKYNPSQIYSTASHLSFDVAASLDKNPVGTALRNKSKQLKGAPEDALRGVIVCDGGCALLTKRHRSSGTYLRDEVARDFLRQSNTVDFVLFVATTTPGAQLRDYRWHNELILPARAYWSARLSEDVAHRLHAVLLAALNHLPPITSTGRNAAYRADEPGVGRHLRGGHEMSSNSVRISVREFMAVMGGLVSQEAYIDAHDWREGKPGAMPNPFSRALRAGRLIRSITVVPGGDKDDDFLEIKFGEPDPAVAPFRVPQAPPKSDGT